MAKHKKKGVEPLLALKKVIDIGFYTLIPFSLLYLITGIVSNSITILAITLKYGLSFIVQLFAFKSIRTILKTNILKFPYGTGKLENFSSLLYGSLVIPTAFFIIYSSGIRLFSSLEKVSFGIAQISLIPSLIRSILLYMWTSKLIKKSKSPMIHLYYSNFRVSTLLDVSVITGISIGFFLTLFGNEKFAYAIDPILSIIVALYMLYKGIRMTVGNFKAMVDFPLGEEDQLKIMGVIGQKYERYEDIGNIYTRISGERRFIEMELYFSRKTSLAEIINLREEMETQLREHFGNIHFTLVPLYSH